jgi:hypothetical protein
MLAAFLSRISSAKHLLMMRPIEQVTKKKTKGRLDAALNAQLF